MSKKYIAKGLVYGKYWGGGFGAYQARELKAKTKKSLLKEALKGLKSGTLDSGMGFEYLKGVLLNIQEVETVNIKGKEYSRSEYITEFAGELTEQEQDFLLECEY